MLKSVELYYFSPTGGTKRTAEIFCAGLSENIETINLVEEVLKNPVGDLVVVAAPVFGGRIPAVVTEKLKSLEGNDKKAVTLAVYGNRAYEDALLELNNIMKECGFVVVASAALIAQHSIVPEVGAGRPDEADAAEIRAFAEKVLTKIEKTEIEEGQNGPVAVPGNYPYKESKGASASPVSTSSCSGCGACAAICPTGAIQIVNGQVATNQEKCILCMACIANCPGNARMLPQPLQEAMEQKLGAFKSIRRENEFFIEF